MTKTQHNKRLESARAFAAACHYEQGHAEHVRRLAETLFDALHPLHGLDTAARQWLTYAAVLHDIGWMDGQQRHHKTSMRMILDDTTLPLTDEERIVVALVARYHRKALPQPTHQVYAELNPQRRQFVDTLAAILRLADGLDRNHSDAIKAITATVTDTQIDIRCTADGDAADELYYGKAKADLLERVFGRAVVLVLTKR